MNMQTAPTLEALTDTLEALTTTFGALKVLTREVHDLLLKFMWIICPHLTRTRSFERIAFKFWVVLREFWEGSNGG